MKKEYKDLTNEEKKEYHLFKNITLELPYLGVIFLFSIMTYPLSFSDSGKYLPMWHFGLIAFTYLLTYLFYYKDKKEFKKLYGL